MTPTTGSNGARPTLASTRPRWKSGDRVDRQRHRRRPDVAVLARRDTQEVVVSASGDGAYDTIVCHEAIAQSGAQALIPTRKNANRWKDQHPGAKARNAILAATCRLGGKIWKKCSGYHRLSLVETQMRCFKLLGERVMACDFDR